MKHTININTLVDTIELKPSKRKLDLDKLVSQRLIKEINKVTINDGDEVEINIKKLIGLVSVNNIDDNCMDKSPKPKPTFWQTLFKRNK